MDGKLTSWKRYKKVKCPWLTRQTHENTEKKWRRDFVGSQCATRKAESVEVFDSCLTRASCPLPTQLSPHTSRTATTSPLTPRPNYVPPAEESWRASLPWPMTSLASQPILTDFGFITGDLVQATDFVTHWVSKSRNEEEKLWGLEKRFALSQGRGLSVSFARRGTLGRSEKPSGRRLYLLFLYDSNTGHENNNPKKMLSYLVLILFFVV